MSFSLFIFWKNEGCSQKEPTAVNVSNQEADFCVAENVFYCIGTKIHWEYAANFQACVHKCNYKSKCEWSKERLGLCRAGV